MTSGMVPPEAACDRERNDEGSVDGLAMKDEIFTVQQVAEQFQYSPRFMRNKIKALVKAGRIGVIGRHRSMRLDRKAIEALRESLRGPCQEVDQTKDQNSSSSRTRSGNSRSGISSGPNAVVNADMRRALAVAEKLKKFSKKDPRLG